MPAARSGVGHLNLPGSTRIRRSALSHRYSGDRNCFFIPELTSSISTSFEIERVDCETKTRKRLCGKDDFENPSLVA